MALNLTATARLGLPLEDLFARGEEAVRVHVELQTQGSWTVWLSRLWRQSVRRQSNFLTPPIMICQGNSVPLELTQARRGCNTNSKTVQQITHKPSDKSCFGP